MGEIKKNKAFLEKQLELWKLKVSKRKKWTNLVESYKNKHAELIERLDQIKTIFDADEIELLKNTFSEDYKLSKEGSIEFFKKFENKETIDKVFGEEHFKKYIDGYKDTYIYQKVKEAQYAFTENMKIFNNDTMKSFHKVGNWKKSDPKNLKHNSGKSKGSMLQYLIIEYLTDQMQGFNKIKLIKFYDLSINILWTPHSIKNAIGLHYNVNNNNFILHLLEFYTNISTPNNNEWKGYLNAIWPKREGDIFTKFNTNSVIELHSWINLGVLKENSIVSIYNDKTISTLQLLMGNSEDKLDEISFYQLYKEYIDKEPYPNQELTDIQKVIYADQFFQYIHELIVEIMHKNIIYYGAPGTGKTFHVTTQLKELYQIKDSNMKIVQFHPSYGYEDFIEGIKPKGLTSKGDIKFELVNGIFKNFCIDAFSELKKANDEDREPEEFYFVVDEINRAELSRVLGELFLCLEEDKRLRFKNNKIEGIKIETQYSSLWNEEHILLRVNECNRLVDQGGKACFGVPENIHFIGTMNDIDRSIDSFDMALRRRFVWIRKDCNYEVLEEWLYENDIEDNIAEKYIDVCKELNNYIVNDLSLGNSYQIGHAYFMKLKLDKKSNNLKNEMLILLWNNHIQPLLHEYLRAEYSENDLEDKLKKAIGMFTLNDTDS